MNSDKKEKLRKVFSVTVSIIILGLLVLSGPAQAFNLGISAVDSHVVKGENLEFAASLNIEDSDSYLPVKELSLILDGPVKRECVFDVSGNKISGCDGVNISKIENIDSRYGYGYGYGNGVSFGYGYGYGYSYGLGKLNLTYNIILDSSNYSAGEYSVNLSAKIGDKIYSEMGENIVISESGSASTGSSSYSGGGGSVTCVTNWNCSVWGTCINGVEKRSCVKETIFCYAGEEPETERKCNVTGEVKNEGENLAENSSVQNETRNSGNGITGAVIGTFKSGTTWIILGVILALLGSAMTVLAIRKRRFYRVPKQADSN